MAARRPPVPRGPGLPALALAVTAALAGVASACRDPASCASYSTCTDTAMLYRTGHLCHSFPWYQGKEPLRNGLQWSLGRRCGMWECGRDTRGLCFAVEPVRAVFGGCSFFGVVVG